jgi:anhydro-N-acetylmuramic acid kinase
MRNTMPHEIYLGLMSGTSLDAVDAVAVSFTPQLTLHGSFSLPLSEDIRQDILALCLPGKDEIDRMGQLDRRLGRLFADAVNHLLADAAIDRLSVRAIGSHGQTLRHRPGLALPFSLQIADPNTIAELTGITVVADFRRRDIAAGGQGAPLVPAFHQALFRSVFTDRVILNLGGIANITLLPRGAEGLVRGYDTGPANMLLDGWCKRHRGTAYDHGGEWGLTGQVHTALLAQLFAHPYFARPAPKSTGREEFNLPWLDNVLDTWKIPFAAADVQATLTELTAQSIANAIRHEGFDNAELWVCGGGAYNKGLMQRLAHHLPRMRIGSTAEQGLSPTWVEATAFAWLARQTIMGLSGNAPEVTGARGERILGGIYPA